MIGRSVAYLLALLAFPALPAQAQSPVDLELVLLADASGSIDQAEIRLQREGYAQALMSEEIQSAIAQGVDGRIAVTYVEWGTAMAQDVVVPWTVIDGPASAAHFAQALRAAPRRAFGRNAIGSAIAKGQVADRGQRHRGPPQGHRPFGRQCQQLERCAAGAGRGGAGGRHHPQRPGRPVPRGRLQRPPQQL